jgi:putative glutamine amidotransferase
MKPFVALNMDINVDNPLEARVGRRYINAMQLGGAIPLPVPPTSKRDLSPILSTVSGVLLIGGLDYSPTLYGEEPSATVKQLHADRQEFDLRLVRMALKRELPILAICGGHQLLNIALGGSLFQDIDEQKAGIGSMHRVKNPPPYKMHSVSLTKGSKLRRIFRKAELPSVLSSHHQAVKRLGKGLSAVAHAADGVIEAIELDSAAFVVGVQWHPEGTMNESAPLFRAFVNAAKAYRS